MHILLTDRLSCPRCGPAFGLILIADSLEDRRVFEGSLGCSNCRCRYPISKGFVNLRPPPRTDTRDNREIKVPKSPTLMELAGLLGITGGVGYAGLLGGMAGHSGALAEKLEVVEIIGVAPELQNWDEAEGISRMDTGSRLPFQDHSLRGVALFGEEKLFEPQEVARVVVRSGRVVVWGGVEGWDNALDSVGMKVLIAEDKAVVAVGQ